MKYCIWDIVLIFTKASGKQFPVQTLLLVNRSLVHFLDLYASCYTQSTDNHIMHTYILTWALKVKVKVELE